MKCELLVLQLQWWERRYARSTVCAVKRELSDCEVTRQEASVTCCVCHEVWTVSLAVTVMRKKVCEIYCVCNEVWTVRLWGDETGGLSNLLCMPWSVNCWFLTYSGETAFSYCEIYHVCNEVWRTLSPCHLRWWDGRPQWPAVQWLHPLHPGS